MSFASFFRSLSRVYFIQDPIEVMSIYSSMEPVQPTRRAHHCSSRKKSSAKLRIERVPQRERVETRPAYLSQTLASWQSCLGYTRRYL